MGSFFSRHQKSTIEVLEGLEKEILSLETYKRHTQLSQKQAVGRLIIFSIVLYLVGAFIFYFYYFPHSWQEAALRLLPFLVFPFLILGLKAGLNAWFVRSLEINDQKMTDKRQDRREILDNVKENETYKVAKEILEKFDPNTKLERAEKERVEKERQEREMIRRMSPSVRQRNVRQRSPVPAIQAPPTSSMRTPVPQRPPPPSDLSTPLPHMMLTGRASLGALPVMVAPNSVPNTPRLTPRPILPKERTPMDKLVDYLLGDGPSNRFALICTQCHSHNGMALREDFEYLAFRCCYCAAFNPARKQRPLLPKTELFPALPAPPPAQNQQQGRSMSVSDLNLEQNALAEEETPQASDKEDDEEEEIPDPVQEKEIPEIEATQE